MRGRWSERRVPPGPGVGWTAPLSRGWAPRLRLHTRVQPWDSPPGPHWHSSRGSRGASRGDGVPDTDQKAQAVAPESETSRFCALGCRTHTLHTLDRSHAHLWPLGSAKPPAEGPWALSRGQQLAGRLRVRDRQPGSHRRGSSSSSFSLLLLAPSVSAPSSGSSRKWNVFPTFCGAA